MFAFAAAYSTKQWRFTAYYEKKCFLLHIQTWISTSFSECLQFSKISWKNSAAWACKSPSHCSLFFFPVQAEHSHPLLALFVRQLLHPCGTSVTIFCTSFNLDLVATSLQVVVLSQYHFGETKTLLGNPQLYFEFCLTSCIWKFQSRFSVSITQRILVSASSCDKMSAWDKSNFVCDSVHYNCTSYESEHTPQPFLYAGKVQAILCGIHCS